MAVRLWKSVPDNVQWGLLWGAGAATFFSFISLVIWLFIGFPIGSIEISPSRWGGMTIELSIWRILGGYWIAFLGGGAVTGWLRPVGQRSYWGASLVGIAAGLVVSFPIFAALIDVDEWTTEVLVMAVISPLLLGPFYAAILKWRYSGKLEKQDSGRWDIKV